MLSRRGFVLTGLFGLGGLIKAPPAPEASRFVVLLHMGDSTCVGGDWSEHFGSRSEHFHPTLEGYALLEAFEMDLVSISAGRLG